MGVRIQVLGAHSEGWGVCCSPYRCRWAADWCLAVYIVNKGNAQLRNLRNAQLRNHSVRGGFIKLKQLFGVGDVHFALDCWLLHLWNGGNDIGTLFFDANCKGKEEALFFTSCFLWLGNFMLSSLVWNEQNKRKASRSYSGDPWWQREISFCNVRRKTKLPSSWNGNKTCSLQNCSGN